ncbi:MAG: helix-turn-helix domain-containing protein [Devosia sp.]
MAGVFFSWRQAILESNLQPTTRHVLLTLACHMNDAGESCYPSIELLCKETGLSNRSVITHLQNANQDGWIQVSKHGFSGQRWANHEYRMSWPKDFQMQEVRKKVVNEVHNVSEKAVNQIHDLNIKVVNVVPEGSEPSSKKVVKEVHTSTSMSTSVNSPINPTTLSATPEKVKPIADTELQTACKATWKSYCTAYFNRYGVDPLRNLSVNSTIKLFVKKLPYTEAPLVAAFFVNHNDKFYIQKTHAVPLMLKDAEGLRTQWATGQTMTGTKASQIDKTASNYDSAQQAMVMLRRKHAAK